MVVAVAVCVTGDADEEPVAPDVVEATGGLTARFEVAEDGGGAVPRDAPGCWLGYGVVTGGLDESREHRFVVEEAIREVAGHVCLVAVCVVDLQRKRRVLEDPEGVRTERSQAGHPREAGEHLPSLHTAYR